MKNVTLTLALVVAFAGSAHAMDGLKALVHVTQMKAATAEEQTAESAEKQREHVKKQQTLRNAQAQYD